ncbi:MAG TPA: tRNA (adenosine(37)-N6)-threonylcarbamoyltransferase complex ATPase subunit type 1 TsaE [Candidatus Rikenella faecigallinarum]|uniref:tRNA threonylcarbamoyladenosine biosynthesis protein TsaE n=1 Tax=Candidatus Rikenella faecigallinarum TaxID=2838745 RepID=A0A9D1TXZ0_9BACT|nr:tRNA (adenosine(37)-N6)-threonylcarbamoyltransferase complex ATPase subunit type 1 TsaE [Candidatus Rikenella faecigallinarum]
MKSITIKGLSDLPEAAEVLLSEAAARQASIIAFYGAMGAGKTTLIKEMCRQLGIDPQEVNSPSFAIVNVYEPQTATDDDERPKNPRFDGPVYHFDFYRIRSVEEAFDFGYEEYFFSGDLCLVEWPEKIEELIPEDALRVRLTALDEDTRVLEMED